MCVEGKSKSATEQSHDTFFFLLYLVIAIVIWSVCCSYSYSIMVHDRVYSEFSFFFKSKTAVVVLLRDYFLTES